MIISDHIGLPLLAGKHPLVGPLAQSFSGKRFTPMSDAYDVALRQLAWEVADEIGLASCVHRSGTYFMVSGPTYETRAESRMILNMGGDVVGMSTVPEVAVARHCGMRVLGISLATNSIRNEHGPVASHDEVLRTARSREQEIGNLLTEVIAKLDMETFSQIESRLEEAGAAYDAIFTSASPFSNVDSMKMFFSPPSSLDATTSQIAELYCVTSLFFESGTVRMSMQSGYSKHVAFKM
eukprot:CAMPEP_0171517520 /NCGR_PEP_ID=MMETSP0959-20130129/4740_1 /TAXON_ID=87120 /ORGANISM="Aurantiochytrium limacinum, Strain ATCCMYA-1381" /LENGTH=237 /DNA_ID=CAMNT_0012056555 /DNA_START=63 /DNA_END=773 /DNA_ORIENTATION=+